MILCNNDTHSHVYTIVFACSDEGEVWHIIEFMILLLSFFEKHERVQNHVLVQMINSNVYQIHCPYQGCVWLVETNDIRFLFALLNAYTWCLFATTCFRPVIWGHYIDSYQINTTSDLMISVKRVIELTVDGRILYSCKYYFNYSI